MNQFIKALMILGFISFSFSTTAQKKNSEIGGGFNVDASRGDYYDSDLDFMGCHLRSYIYLNDNIRFVPSVQFNLPYEEEWDIYYMLQVKLFTMNGEAHYLLNLPSLSTINPYVLGGISYNKFKVTYTDRYDIEEERLTETSLSLGIGFDYPLKRGRMYAEFKSLFGDYDPWGIALGFIYPINKNNSSF